MTPEELKAQSRRHFEEGWNKRNLAVLEEQYAPNVVFHHPTNPQKDREGMMKFTAAVQTSWPDLHVTIHDLMAAEADKAVVRWTFEGTDTGGSVGLGTPPTGKHVTVTFITIFSFEGGRIVEEWWEADYLNMVRQMGFTLTPP